MSDREQSRLNIILLTVLINILAVVWISKIPSSDWRTGMFLNLLDNFILIAYAIIRRDRFMLNLLLFGLAVGFAELPADAWLVETTRTLDYSIGGGPMLWKSPLWMPFAWEIVAVQFGYIGLRLWERFGLRGLWLAGFLGAINIPFYEEMALRTHWWVYTNCRMFLHTPYYIIFGEFLIVLTLGWCARYLRREKIFVSVLSGLASGAAIFICYLVPYQLIERIL